MPANLLTTLVETSALKGSGSMPGEFTDDPRPRKQILGASRRGNACRKDTRWAGEGALIPYG